MTSSLPGAVPVRELVIEWRDDQLPAGRGSRHGPEDVLARPGDGQEVVPPRRHQGGDLRGREGFIGRSGERAAAEIHVPVATDEQGAEASTSAAENRKRRGDRTGRIEDP